MKKIYLALSLMLLVLSASSQITFQKGYGDATANTGEVLVVTNDNSYLIVGSTGYDAPDSSDVAAYRLDQNGDLLWTYKYGLTGDEYPSSAIELSDGEFLIVGTTYANALDTANSDIFLMRIDGSGFLYYTKYYDILDNDDAYKILRAPDGNFVIAGYTDSATFTTFGFLMEVDSATGSPLWSKVYTPSSYVEITSMDRTANGDYVFGGSHLGSTNENYIMKTDTAGNLLWSKTISPAGGISEIKSTSDNGFVTVGIAQPTSGNVDQCVMKFDSSGAVQWNYTYGGASQDYAVSIVQNSLGNYAVAGYSDLGSSGNPLYRLVIEGLDANGAVQWSNAYGSNVAQSDGLQIQKTADGGYAVSGFSTAFGDPLGDAYIVKTDASGISGCYEDPFVIARQTNTVVTADLGSAQDVTPSELPVSVNSNPFSNQFSTNCFFNSVGKVNTKPSFLVFPNPAEDRINFITENGNGVLTITDIAGHVLSISKIESDQQSVDVSSLAKGIYLLKFNSEYGTSANTLIKN